MNFQLYAAIPLFAERPDWRAGFALRLWFFRITVLVLNDDRVVTSDLIECCGTRPIREEY